MAGVTIDILRQLLPTHDIVRYDNSTQHVTLRDGSVLCVWSYRQSASAQSCASALERLNGDSTVPALCAADVAGRLCGTAFVVGTAPRGQMLAHAGIGMSHDQRYAIGQQLGQMVARWHALTYAGFGALNDATHKIGRAHV